MKNTPRINLDVYCLIEIFKYLNLEQRSRCARVCRSWYEADSYIKIKELDIYLSVLKNEESKNYVFVKNIKQLTKIFKSIKFNNLEILKIYSFKNTKINLPIIDLKNFTKLKKLDLSGYFYDHNIFMTLLDNNIKLNNLEQLNAAIVHINIVNKIFPNLKVINTTELLISGFEDNIKLNLIEFNQFGIKACPANIIYYLSRNALSLERLTLTVEKLSFLSDLEMNKLKYLNINCIPENLIFLIQQLPFFKETIIKRELKFKINAIPINDFNNLDNPDLINNLNVFDKLPFKTTYDHLINNYNFNNSNDLEYFLNNFHYFELTTKIDKKIKLLKYHHFKMNNIKELKFKFINPNPKNINYLFSYLFKKIPNLCKLEILNCSQFDQNMFNQLPSLWPNLMELSLRSGFVIKLETNFIFNFKSLTSVELENFNLLNDGNINFIVKRINYLNHLITINCQFNLKNVYSDFLKKSKKYPNIQFKINLNQKMMYQNFNTWNKDF